MPVFLQQFSGPITVGGYANASTVQVATAFKCATVLRDTISPYLLRRMKEDVKKHINLPEKNEQVLFCRLTDQQRSLYKAYIEGDQTKSILNGQLKVFVGLIALRKICNHPDLFSGGPKYTEGEVEDGERDREYEFGFYKRSGKMVVVHSLLKLWRKQGHRVLLFSQSQMMLTIIESYVKQQDYKYLRLDGRTPVGSRQKLITEFNGGDHFVFILTTKVGGLGVNLTGANRVLIFDPDWNPSTDTQARERSWRIGQDRNVTIYRLMTAGTIEEKIYHRQIFKQFLVNRILKDPKQRRFFKSNDLYELFTLSEATEEDNTETSAIFAGTGANIKVRPRQRSRDKTGRVPVFKPKTNKSKRAVEADGAGTDVQSSLTRLYSEEEAREEAREEQVITEEVRDRLREQARRISAKLSKKKSVPVPSKGSKEINSEEQKEIHSEELKEIYSKEPKGIQSEAQKEVNSEGFKEIHHEEDKEVHFDEHKVQSKYSIPKVAPKVSQFQNQQCDKSPSRDSGPRSKRKEKKHKRKHKDKKFDGVKVPHLVKQRRYKAPLQEEEEKARQDQSQDNYVLAKLFSKSGVHSALQHDAIVEGEQADYAIVESEANEVARNAVRAMKNSRRDCHRAETGAVNWTGNNGARNKPKFGPKKKKPPGPSMSSTELLSIMKERNRLVSNLGNESEDEEELFRPDGQQSSGGSGEERVQQGDMDLLTDIRNFVAFQVRESLVLQELLLSCKIIFPLQAESDGEASTAELLQKFKRSLPSQKSPLFKAFLQQICDFSRDFEGKGIWKLKTEFR